MHRPRLVPPALAFSSKFCQKSVTRRSPSPPLGSCPGCEVEAGFSALWHLFCSAWALGSIWLGLNSSSSMMVTFQSPTPSEVQCPHV